MNAQMFHVRRCSKCHVNPRTSRNGRCKSCHAAEMKHFRAARAAHLAAIEDNEREVHLAVERIRKKREQRAASGHG